MQQTAAQDLVDELLKGVFAELTVDKHATVEREEGNDILVRLDERLEPLANLLNFWVFFFGCSIECDANLDERIIQVIRLVFMPALDYAVSN